MARFLFKLIICLLLAGAAGLTYLSMRSGDPLYTLYEWINPARFQQHDALIRAVAAEHQLDPMLVKAPLPRTVSWRAGTSLVKTCRPVTTAQAANAA